MYLQCVFQTEEGVAYYMPGQKMYTLNFVEITQDTGHEKGWIHSPTQNDNLVDQHNTTLYMVASLMTWIVEKNLIELSNDCRTSTFVNYPMLTIHQGVFMSKTQIEAYMSSFVPQTNSEDQTGSYNDGKTHYKTAQYSCNNQNMSNSTAQLQRLKPFIYLLIRVWNSSIHIWV